MKRKFFTSLSAVMLAAMLALLLIFEDSASNAVRHALCISAESVIPSVFTYSVVSSLITGLDLLEPFYKRINSEWLFYLPRAASPVILCGLLCGFPIGASGAAGLYENGKISCEDAAYLTAMSSCASPAFLLGSVGGWWGDKKFGLLLYLTSVLTSLAFGAVCGIIRRKRGGDKRINKARETDGKKPCVSSALCGAISSSAMTSLNITAYIVFFSVLRAIITRIFPSLALPAAALLEFSSGAYMGAVESGLLGAAFTGFSVGFSSLSVFMQTASFASRSSISLLPYALSKLISGITCTLAASLYYIIHPMTPSAIKTASLTPFPAVRVVLCLVIMSFLCVFFGGIYRKRK